MIQFLSPLHIHYEIYNRTLPYKVELAFLASVHTLSSGYFQVSEASSCGEGSTGCPCKLETLNGDIFESRHFFYGKKYCSVLFFDWDFDSFDKQRKNWLWLDSYILLWITKEVENSRLRQAFYFFFPFFCFLLK